MIVGSNILAGASGQGGGYLLNRSVRFRSSAGGNFTRTPVTNGNNTTCTWSGWVKLGVIGTSGTLFSATFNPTPAQNVSWFQYDGTTLSIVNFVSNVFQANAITTAVFRDPSAWYHMVFVWDTTNATATDRCRIYVNGVRQTLTFNTTPALNNTAWFNSANLHAIGRDSRSAGGYFDGYLAEINYIDGQALTPTSFGEYNTLTGVWQPKKYGGTYGTNGFYLNFNDNSAATAAAIGKDSSGNGNNWTPNNISVTAGATYDSMTDVPTLTSPTQANFSTWNPLIVGGSVTYSNGNLATTASGNNNTTRSTMAAQSGKYYAEFVSTSATYPAGGAFPRVGISDVTETNTNMDGSVTVSWAGYPNDSYVNGVIQSWAGYAANDVIGIAFNAATRQVWFSKNGSWQNFTGSGADPATGTNPAATVAGSNQICFAARQENTTWVANFGQRPFSYTPPSGFTALNSYNLPTPTIANGAEQFAATLWTGDGTTPRSFANTVNGISFQPDFVWVKSRNAGVSHSLNDSVRSFGTTRNLQSNTTGAEGSGGANGAVSAALSNGFTVVAGATDSANVNNNTVTYVGWQWKASNAAAVTNTSGSISSQVSANTTAGFSIVTRTGTGVAGTVGHGLGIAPKMIINKSRSNGAYNWSVYHASLTNANFVVYLDATNAQQSDPNTWNGTAPTSTVFSIGSGAQTNINTATYVNYCFSEIAGYSKFASYIGNGSTNGTFVFLGFRPRWLMIKRIDTAGYGWNIYDTTRSPYNIAQIFLQTNVPNAETNNAAYAFDLLSNGFKLRQTDALINASGGTYIYAAFAENPFNYSLAR